MPRGAWCNVFAIATPHDFLRVLSVFSVLSSNCLSMCVINDSTQLANDTAMAHGVTGIHGKSRAHVIFSRCGAANDGKILVSEVTQHSFVQILSRREQRHVGHN